MDEINQAIEAAKQELAILEAQIATLKARKSIIECIRKDYSREPLTGVLKRKVRRKGVEITITEADYQRLTVHARSADWLEQKIAELKSLGDRLWHRLDQAKALKEPIRRYEDAEYRCRCLENEIGQLLTPPVQEYELDEDGDREIDPTQAIEWDDREI